jgi:Ca2+-binding EF-hand superfamily protein
LLLAQGTESKETTAKRLFSFFDEDGSGAIDKQEMLEKLEMVGFDASGIDQLFVSISGSPQQVRGT